jgi:VWFA-related protein
MNRNLTRNLSLFFFLVLFWISAHAQQATPAPNEPAATVRSTTDLVVVDVVATDAKQNPIHQLTAADFTLLEDGKPQTPKVFEEHAAGPPAAMGPIPKLGPGAFTNYSPVPTTGTLNILLFDKLNTPLTAQTDVRNQVLKYLKEAPQGRRTAIFALTTELKLLQGFTSDPELLRALVSGKKGNQTASPLMNDAMNGDQPGADDPMMDMEMDALGNTPDGATALANLQQFEAEQQTFQLRLRQQYTLDALNQLARYMSMLPGRKNLIWFSGSFPISILPDDTLPNPFAVVISAEDEFRETVDLLTRGQVAVYPIDARGLMVAPMLGANQSGSTMMRTPNGFANANTKWFQQTANEQGTMQQMAEATGGRSFVNTNGLKEAVEKAIEIGSNYYTLAYTPTNRDWNGAFRKIQVKVDRPGVTLAYRRGYFADDPDKPAHRNQQQAALTGTTQYSAIRAAMLRGAPDPTELLFVATVRPTTGDTETSPAPGNQAGKKLSGPFHRYTVTYLASPKSFNCASTPGGTRHCALEYLTFLYDSEGTLVNMQSNAINANIPEAAFADPKSHGLTYHQQISVPVKGEYFLRIGMRDASTDNVGALELPIASVAKLTPITALSAETQGRGAADAKGTPTTPAAGPTQSAAPQR